MKLLEQAEALVALYVAKREAGDAAKAASAEYQSAMEAMAIRLAEEGLQNVKLATGETIKLTRSAYFRMADGFTTEQVVEAFKRNELGDLVKETYAAQTLKAYVSELHDQTDEVVDDLTTLLPEELQPMFISGVESPTVGVTGVKKKKMEAR